MTVSITVTMRPGANPEQVGAAVEELVSALGGGQVIQTSNAFTASIESAGYISGQTGTTAVSLLSAVKTFAYKLLTEPGVANTILKVAIVGGSIAIAWQGVNFYIDHQRAQALSTLIQDESVPLDIRQRAMEGYLENYTRPPTIFGEIGNLLLIGGALAAGGLVLYWVLFKRPSRSGGAA